MWKCWTNSNYAYKFYLPFDFEISDYMVFLPRSTLTHLPPLSMVTLCRYLGSKNRHSSVMLIRQLILIDLIEWFLRFFISLHPHTPTNMFVWWILLLYHLVPFWFLGFHSSTICRRKVPREQHFTVLICWKYL